MTDLEKFVHLYRSVGVPLTVQSQNGAAWHDLPENAVQFIELREGSYGDGTARTVGYTGFYTRIFFDDSGEFVAQGIWE